ncbi:MAG TPA: HIT domain-containing protein [Candidatus Acidoferrales bacterium]|nr:HIT domain-containing protein [Candidatus Acidoferrales bacterium]
MKQLWAPWRMLYIEGAKENECIFCTKPKDPDPRASLVLGQTPHSVVMLNKYPYNNGHLLVAPKRHARDFCALSGPEYADLNRLLKQSVEIVYRALSPGGINLGMNLGHCAGAGVEDHLHWHVVPRWEGDTNFMPVIGEVRVIPEHLAASYDRLRTFFEDLLREK